MRKTQFTALQRGHLGHYRKNPASTEVTEHQHSQRRGPQHQVAAALKSERKTNYNYDSQYLARPHEPRSTTSGYLPPRSQQPLSNAIGDALKHTNAAMRVDSQLMAQITQQVKRLCLFHHSRVKIVHRCLLATVILLDTDLFPNNYSMI